MLCVYIYIYIYMYMCVCVYMCVYIYICVYIYTVYAIQKFVTSIIFNIKSVMRLYLFDQKEKKAVILWNIIAISDIILFPILIYFKISFISVTQCWIFISHYSSLQCHMILQKSF